jgi:hypothetical protein
MPSLKSRQGKPQISPAAEAPPSNAAADRVELSPLFASAMRWILRSLQMPSCTSRIFLRMR